MTPLAALSQATNTGWKPKVLDDLRALGFVIVPVEATDGMRIAGAAAMNAHRVLGSRFKNGSPDIWRVMVAAYAAITAGSPI